MITTISVSGEIHFEFQIDEEAVSDWDGAKILEVIKKRGIDNDVYTKDATLFDLLANLGYILAVENRTMGSFDGWADFPASAASGSPFSVSFDPEYVHIEGRGEVTR